MYINYKNGGGKDKLFYWEVPNVSKRFVMGQSKCPIILYLPIVVNEINTRKLIQIFLLILPLAFLFHLGIPKHILVPCYTYFGHVKVPKGYVKWYLACYVTLGTCYLACYTFKFFFKII
jgi:hypothetical protein